MLVLLAQRIAGSTGSSLGRGDVHCPNQRLALIGLDSLQQGAVDVHIVVVLHPAR